MRAAIWLLSASLAATGVTACPTATPPPDAGEYVKVTLTPDAAQGVCSHLEAVGCHMPPTCARVLAADQGKLVDFKPTLLLAATSRGAVEAVGTVSCGAGP